MSIINYVRGVGVLVTGTVAAYITQNSQFPLKDSFDNPFAPLILEKSEAKVSSLVNAESGCDWRGHRVTHDCFLRHESCGLRSDRCEH